MWRRLLFLQNVKYDTDILTILFDMCTLFNGQDYSLLLFLCALFALNIIGGISGESISFVEEFYLNWIYFQDFECCFNAMCINSAVFDC